MTATIDRVAAPADRLYWLSAADRRALHIAAARHASHVADRAVLDAVLLELSVVEGRATSCWASGIATIHRACGTGADTLPVRLTASEIDAILRLPLPSRIIRRLRANLCHPLIGDTP